VELAMRKTFLSLIYPELERKELDKDKAERWFNDHPFQLDLYADYKQYSDDVVNDFYESVLSFDRHSKDIDAVIKDAYKHDKEYAKAFKDLRDFFFKQTVFGLLKYCRENSHEQHLDYVHKDNIYRFAWFHFVMTNEIDRCFQDWLNLRGGNYLVVSIPPQHLKSSCYAGGLIPMIMGNRPNAKCLLGTYNASYAGDVVQKDFMTTVNTKGYVDLFGKLFNCNLTPNDKYKIKQAGHYAPADSVQLKGTVYNGRFYGGSLKQVTGQPAQAMLVDDPIPNFSVANSDEEVKKIVNEFNASVGTRTTDGTLSSVIHTRWRTFDPIGSLKYRQQLKTEEEKAERPLMELCFRTWHDPIDDFPYDFRTKENEELWPEERRKAYIDAKYSDELTITALYQQNPIDSSIGIIKREWINEVNPEDIPKEAEKLVISVDTSHNDKKSSDKFCISVIARTKNQNYYFLDLKYSRMSFQQGLEEIEHMVYKYPQYHEIHVELKANGEAVYDVLVSNFSRVIGIKVTEEKKARMQAISPIIESGKFFVPQNHIGSQVIKQLISFTGTGTHEEDDICDTITQSLRRLDKMFGKDYNVEDLHTNTNKPVSGSGSEFNFNMPSVGLQGQSLYNKLSERNKSFAQKYTGKKRISRL
jgi:predicted phage terminase large subunit-like protein